MKGVLALVSCLVVVEISANKTVPVCPENEVYETCQSSSCRELPCNTPKPEACTKDCVSKCFCKPGYARNEKKVCVKCPDIPPCNPNEEYRECQSSSCSDLPCNTPKPKFCTLDCVSKCFCKPGYARDKNNSCTLCPENNEIKTPECPPNQEYRTCQSSSCSDLPCNKPTPQFCTADCQSKCFCKEGYARNSTNDCVKC